MNKTIKNNQKSIKIRKITANLSISTNTGKTINTDLMRFLLTLI